ncbi:MAG TPA: efflux RND transporter periplasmic adaptor subunit [Geminicoccaceae bacterium]|nr:efflux RND transporter periplasmic adaptor subunit [Geminicoccaceae bacterium]
MRRALMRQATGIERATLILVGALALAGCERGSDSGNAAAAPPPPEVTVAHPLVEKLVEWTEFTGRFQAEQQVDVRARVSGYLASIDFQDGQVVDKGQNLFLIDPRPFEAALQRARADLSNAQAQLELAKLEFQRVAKLVGSPAFAQTNYDQRIEERNAADASVASAQAAVQQAQLNLDYTRVSAPVAGRISNRRVDLGNLVTDTTLLTTIVSQSPIYFVFDMSEADFLGYQRAVLAGELPSTSKRSTLVNVKLVDEDNWHRQGQMNFVDNVVDQSSGTVRARAEFLNPDGLIKPGQFGTIRIPGSPEYPAVLIPDEAIVTDQAQKLVMAVTPDNKIVPKAIRPGPQEFGLRIVRKGLTGDDRIVIDGLVRVRPGMEVRPKEGQIQVPSTTAASEG